MWISFDLREFEGYLLPHSMSMVILEHKDLSYDYHVALNLAPSGFWKYKKVDGTKKKRPVLTIWEGWRGLPKWQFNQELYDTGEFPFIPFDNHLMDGGLARVERREKIEARISETMNLGTELKKLRKAIKAILTAVPELAELDDVRGFVDYSNTVEGKIAKYPKENLTNKVEER